MLVVRDVGGRRAKVAFFCLILPHSNVWFVKAYPRETTECKILRHLTVNLTTFDRESYDI